MGRGGGPPHPGSFANAPSATGAPRGLGVDAHDVDAGDVHVDVVRHPLSVHLGTEDRILEDEVAGHDAGGENFAPALHVLDVEG